MAIKILTGAEATAHMAAMPANVMLYGPPGVQKTSDAVKAFARPDGSNGAFYIPCEDGAGKIITARGWNMPDHPEDTIKTWAQMEETVRWLAENRARYSAVILDGWSPFLSNLYREVSARLSGSKNKFEIPTVVRNCAFTLRDWFRMIGLHSVFIAHAVPPAVQDGIFYEGAFESAPKSITRIVFGQLDSVLRVGFITPGPGMAPMRVYFTGGEEWPASLNTLSQPQDWRFWLTKNREGCSQAIVPADLGAFLRSRQPPYAGL